MCARIKDLLRSARPILCAAALSVAGCSLFHPVPKAPLVQAPAAPKPVLPKPTATHYFQVDPDSDVVGYVQRVFVNKDDTLPDIARRFDVGYEEMVTANPGVDPWIPGEGREVVVPTQFVLPAAPREGVVVNVAEMRIYYYPPRKKGEAQSVYTYPIGIGKVGWNTPEGTTKIVGRQKDPVWIVPKSVRDEHAKDGDILPAKVAAGPENPLGRYEFRLSWPSYLIHGTNKPYGVGMRSSHGCMRLYPEDIAMFFDLVPIGTKVTVVNQPYMFGWRDGMLYLQAYAALEDDSRGTMKDRKRLLASLVNPKLGQSPLRRSIVAHSDEIDWDLVAELAHSPRAVPVPVMGTGQAGTGQAEPSQAGAAPAGAAPSGAQAAIDTVLTKSLLVDNVLPEGSNWDGQSGLLVDEKTYNDLVGARDKSPHAAVSAVDSQAQASAR
jgi:L,D-transpeptidase ErfK/SrfK